jgi:hypothetical protein
VNLSTYASVSSSVNACNNPSVSPSDSLSVYASKNTSVNISER